MKVIKSTGCEVDEETGGEKNFGIVKLKGKNEALEFVLQIKHADDYDVRKDFEFLARAGRKLERGEQLDGFDDRPILTKATLTRKSDGKTVDLDTGEITIQPGDSEKLLDKPGAEDPLERDPAFREACNVAVRLGTVTVSVLQAELGGIGEDRARRIMKQFEYEGLVVGLSDTYAQDFWDSNERNVLMDQSEVDSLFTEEPAETDG